MNGILIPAVLPQLAPAPKQDEILPTILWNGAPFTPVFHPTRKTVVVRTAPPASAFHISTAIPAELIQIREHRIEFISDNTTLLVITNAPEAASEIPEAIRTDRREIGTYYTAEATWRGRAERAFISASLTDTHIAATLAASRAGLNGDHAPLRAYVAVAGDVLRAGLVLQGMDFTYGLSPEETLTANLLIKLQNPQSKTIYSHEAIGAAMEVSGETIRRREKEIARKSPQLGGIIASVRSVNAKGQKLPPAGAENGEDAHEV